MASASSAPASAASASTGTVVRPSRTPLRWMTRCARCCEGHLSHHRPTRCASREMNPASAWRARAHGRSGAPLLENPRVSSSQLLHPLHLQTLLLAHVRLGVVVGGEAEAAGGALRLHPAARRPPPAVDALVWKVCPQGVSRTRVADGAARSTRASSRAPPASAAAPRRPTSRCTRARRARAARWRRISSPRLGALGLHRARVLRHVARVRGRPAREHVAHACSKARAREPRPEWPTCPQRGRAKEQPRVGRRAAAACCSASRACASQTTRTLSTARRAPRCGAQRIDPAAKRADDEDAIRAADFEADARLQRSAGHRRRQLRGEHGRRRRV